MACKIADGEVETEDLMWQPLGTGLPAGPTSRPAAKPFPPSSLKGAPTADQNLSGGDGNLDIHGLRQRLADLESARPAELEQARKTGFEQGLKQGRQEATNEMQDALDRLARTIQEVAQIKGKVRAEAENELVKLSLAIARRILHREMTADPQSLRGVVYAALQRLQNREVTKIRVYPASVPAVRAALERNGGMAGIEILGDALLPPGGLLLETAFGELDASVETQLQEIERGFADRLQLQ